MRSSWQTARCATAGITSSSITAGTSRAARQQSQRAQGAELAADASAACCPRRIVFHRRRAAKDSNRWPIDVHALGLKFGIHVMRGIPRQAVRGEHAH